MRNLNSLAVAFMAAIWPAAALAEVKVNFVDPERYKDANLQRETGKTAKDLTMREIERTFWQLGEAYLAPDETLTIDVLDVDLAGRFEPWQFNFKNVRFMREYYWPEMKIRYRLESPSRPISSSEETIADRYYLRDAIFGGYSGTMVYEKLMLERWFKMRFTERGPVR
jgi:hypothetical protein